jgi:hypothetical protein
VRFDAVRREIDIAVDECSTAVKVERLDLVARLLERFYKFLDITPPVDG